MTRRITALLLALLLLLSLVACGSGADTTDNSAANTTADSSETADSNEAADNNETADSADLTPPAADDTAADIVPPADEEPADVAPPADESKDTDPAGDSDSTVSTENKNTAPRPRAPIDPSKPMVALTFDDGPHRTYTDAILDILEQNGAVATFFEVANNLSQDPAAVRRAAALGCEIGSHSLRHDDLGKKSESEIIADAQKANAKFAEVLGYVPTLLRPPYGSVSNNPRRATNQSLIMWSVDTLDWKYRDPTSIMNIVKESGNLNGDVILMHSIHQTSVQATAILVPWLMEQGYQLVTVSELITYHYGEEVLSNGLYNYGYFSIGQNVQLPPARPEPTPVTPTDPVTPPESGEVTPPESGEVTPPEGGEVAPPEGGEVAPPEGGEVAPPEGSEVTPPEGGENTPPEGGEVTPPEGGEDTPPAADTDVPPDNAADAA